MQIRALRDNESLDTVAEELLFTGARLKNDEHAKELAPTMSDLMARVDQVRGAQVGTWRDEVMAQVAVSTADDLLDDWIRGFGRALTDLVQGNTESLRYKRYFTSAPHTFIHLGLESEISRVRGWISSLATEPEQSLQDLGAGLASIVEQGEAALEQRRLAVSARNDHRVRAIAPLVEEINTARIALFGSLAKKASEVGLPPDWPSRFFRRSSRTSKAPPTAPTGDSEGGDSKPDDSTS